MGRVFWPDGRAAAVSLTFDDGRESNLDHGIPVLNGAGLPATFYVLPSAVSSRAAEWRSAVGTNHEIGNHTATHPCSGNFTWSTGNALENYSLGDMQGEITTANSQLEAIFGSAPSSFAYPCYQSYVGRGTARESYVPLVAKAFRAGRGGKSEAANDPHFCDLHSLFATCIDGVSFAEIHALIAEARKSGRWLILVAHDTQPPSSEGGAAKQGVDFDAFRLLCDSLAKSQDLWCGTVSEIADYVLANRGQQ